MSEAWLSPGTHGVLFFDDAPSAHRAIAEFFTAGATAGDPLLLVSRRETFDGVTALLASGRYGPPVEADRIHFVDADIAREQFMRGETVIAARAEAMLHALLAEVRSKRPQGMMRWYGEMVDILCERNNFAAALAIERLVPGFFKIEPRLTILCGYARLRFDGAGAQVFHAVCTEHTHVEKDEDPGAPRESETPPRGTAQPRSTHVYVIDDDDSVRRSLGRLLRLSGFSVRTFDSGEAFLLAFAGLAPGCLVVDIQLAGMSGLDVLAHMKSVRPSWPLLAMSGSDDEAARIEAQRLGARAFLHKPLDSQVLIDAVEAALAG